MTEGGTEKEGKGHFKKKATDSQGEETASENSQRVQVKLKGT